MTKIISFVGKSKTGKTVLIERLIPLFIKEGYIVGTIKHTVHEIAFPEGKKDTTRHFKAGASITTILSSDSFLSMGILDNINLTVEKLIDLYTKLGIDIIFIEGFKSKPFPKVIVANSKEDLDMIPKVGKTICIVSKEKLVDNIPCYSPDKLSEIAECIEREIKNNPSVNY